MESYQLPTISCVTPFIINVFSDCSPAEDLSCEPCTPCFPCTPCGPDDEGPCFPCTPCGPDDEGPCFPCSPCGPDDEGPCFPCTPCGPDDEGPCFPCSPCGPDEGGSGGCFISSACIDYVGLADDCYELSQLRLFRDSYVKYLPNGVEILKEYYKNAPIIVSKIMASSEKENIFERIYKTIQEAINFIESGNNREAFKCYEEMYQTLMNYPEQSLDIYLKTFKKSR